MRTTGHANKRKKTNAASEGAHASFRGLPGNASFSRTQPHFLPFAAPLRTAGYETDDPHALVDSCCPLSLRRPVQPHARAPTISIHSRAPVAVIWGLTTTRVQRERERRASCIVTLLLATAGCLMKHALQCARTTPSPDTLDKKWPRGRQGWHRYAR